MDDHFRVADDLICETLKRGTLDEYASPLVLGIVGVLAVRPGVVVRLRKGYSITLDDIEAKFRIALGAI